MVQNVVDQATAAGFGASKLEAPAVAADFPSYRQPLLQVQQSARAAGVGGGGFGFGCERLGQGGDQGGPLAGQAFAVIFVQDVLDQRRKATAQGGGEAFDLRLRQQFGGGEAAVQLFYHMGKAAQAVALLLAGAGMQRGNCGVDGVEQAMIQRGGEGGAPLPRREVFADFVFGDHLRHGVGDRGRGADDGGDGGVAAAQRVQVAGGGKAAQARDQAVVVRRFGGRQAPDLDREAQAFGGDGGLQFGQWAGGKRDAVAQQGVFADFSKRDLGDVHGASYRLTP